MPNVCETLFYFFHFHAKSDQCLGTATAEIILFSSRGHDQPFATIKTDFSVDALDNKLVNTTSIKSKLTAKGYNLQEAIVRLSTSASGNPNGKFSLLILIKSCKLILIHIFSAAKKLGQWSINFILHYTQSQCRDKDQSQNAACHSYLHLKESFISFEEISAANHVEFPGIHIFVSGLRLWSDLLYLISQNLVSDITW